MNFLAHSLLSFNNSPILVGNLIADLIKKKDEKFYSEDILQGVILHRKIDHFTDEHPLIISLLELFYEDHGKYAPVVLDIYWDYYLVQHWTKFSNENISDFTANVYQTITKTLPQIQPSLQNKLKRMVAADFLMSCMDLDRLHRTFMFIEMRTKFESNFDKAAANMEKNNDRLEQVFLPFFEELLAYSKAEFSLRN